MTPIGNGKGFDTRRLRDGSSKVIIDNRRPLEHRRGSAYTYYRLKKTITNWPYWSKWQTPPVTCPCPDFEIVQTHSDGSSKIPCIK